MDPSLLIFTQIPLQTMLCNLDGAVSYSYNASENLALQLMEYQVESFFQIQHMKNKIAKVIQKVNFFFY